MKSSGAQPELQKRGFGEADTQDTAEGLRDNESSHSIGARHFR